MPVAALRSGPALRTSNFHCCARDAYADSLDSGDAATAARAAANDASCR
ncbi:hypothetical protein ACN6LA_001763 [Streptomyces sp. SAS_269]